MPKKENLRKFAKTLPTNIVYDIIHFLLEHKKGKDILSY